MLPSFEQIISVEVPGLYESNYLKANSPDGQRGVWLKHNLLRPLSGEALAEFWIILFERGQAPIVAKRELPWDHLRLSGGIQISAGNVSLSPDHAVGQVADLRWDLRLSGGLGPLHHLPYRWMYTGGFPKKKMLTPAPNLVFDGMIEVAGRRWEVSRWLGLRGHNWGKEHAHAYAYGNCNLWDDGADRTVDGFTARIKLGSRLSPWLSALVGEGPHVRRNRLRHWLGSGEVAPERWSLGWRGHRPGSPHISLQLSAQRQDYVGLRYAHPDGRESYCYNTKFADVAYEVDGQRFGSRCGELEVLFPEPLAGVALHPATGWSPADGDYRS